MKINLPSINPEQKLLDNGIQVFCFHNDETDALKIEFLFQNCGIKQEKNPASALFTNQLLTEGTTKYSAKQIANHLDYYGVFVEKNIGWESASVCFYFLNSYKEKLVKYFEEIVFNAVFPQKEISLLIEKKTKELERNRLKTQYLANSEFKKALFGKNHIYGRERLKEDYEQIKQEDLLNLYDYYQFSNLTLIMCGNIDDKFLCKLNNIFGNKPVSAKIKAVKQTKITENSPLLKRISLENKVQSSIKMGFKTIAVKDTDYNTLQAVNTLLGGYFGSRLMSNIREKQGLTYGIGSNLYSYSECGVLEIATDVNKDKADIAIESIISELNLLKTKKVQNNELEKVINYMKGNSLRLLDGFMEIAEVFSYLYSRDLSLDYFEKQLQHLNQITPEEILRVSNQYLESNNLTTIVV